VAVTDFVQFVVLAVAVLILLPLSIDKVGGLEGFLAGAPDGFFNLTTPEFDWIYVILLSLMYCVAWSSVNWPLIQRYYCVANEKEAMKVGWLVTVLNIIGPPLMFLPAMAARQFLTDIPPGQEVYPLLCIELLPSGILGLIIAAMFAATMSMLSSDYNVCAGVLTNDVYRRWARPNASQKELVLVGRLTTLLVGGFALGAACMMSAGTGEDLFDYMVTLFSVVTAPIGIPMMFGLLSKKVSNAGAMAGWLCGIIVGLAMFLWCPYIRFSLPGLSGAVLLEKEVAIFLYTSVVTLLAMFVGSRLKPVGGREKQRIEAFHERLSVPIGRLNEDRVEGDTSAGAFSPFRVVGISVLAIGLMLLAVLPWVEGRLAVELSAGFGAVLIVFGGVMTWRSK
jgi:Na+/proline symporter